MLNKRSVGIIEPPLLVSPEHRRGSRGAKTTQIINGLHSCMHTHAYTHLDTRTCCGVLCGSWLMCRLLVKCVTCLQVAQRARVCTHDRTLVAFCSFKVMLLMATPHRGSVKNKQNKNRIPLSLEAETALNHGCPPGSLLSAWKKCLMKRKKKEKLERFRTKGGEVRPVVHSLVLC